MEHLCKIELIGIVGFAKETIVGDQRNVRFSVMVDRVFEGPSGNTIETTWFNCSYWGNCTIEKGQVIHLEGRMVGHSYTDDSGRGHTAYEVKVNRIW